MKDLETLPRSLLGDVNAEFSKFLRNHIDVSTLSFPSGKQVLDWEVPKAWRVVNFEVLLPDGSPLLDKLDPSKHVVQYSSSFSGNLSRADFIKKLNFIEEIPDAIPYKTSYYENDWGLNVPYSLVRSLPEGSYKVNLEVEFYESELKVFEFLLPGNSEREIVFHTYYCHPYMANDNNSGVALAIELAKTVQRSNGNHVFSYRFIFVPETIGAIAYISENLAKLKSCVEKIFVLTCVGDNGPFAIVQPPSPNAAAKAASYFWRSPNGSQISYSWRDRGSDERQYAAPGIELPVCTLSRSKFGTYDVYHTFNDDLNFVSQEGLSTSLQALIDLIKLCELDGIYLSATLCEPMLSKRKLYPLQSVRFNHDSQLKNLTTLISLCNGSRNIIDALILAGIPPSDALETLETAVQNRLIIRKS
jgi:aminopeptidase-like protein